MATSLSGEASVAEEHGSQSLSYDVKPPRSDFAGSAPAEEPGVVTTSSVSQERHLPPTATDPFVYQAPN